MKKEKFEVGNLVSVSGGSIGKDGEVADSAEVCIVAAVGEKDLIVESTSLQASYKVPKALCNVIKKDPSLLRTCKIQEPALGDLVISFERKYYSKEDPVLKTGVLYKIDYKLGNPDRCTILCGSDFDEVAYKNLIVARKNSN